MLVAVVVPKSERLVNPLIIDEVATPLIVLVKVLVVEEKEEELELITVVVANTPFTVLLNTLPVTL
jgi:hypothetical protein